MNDWYNTNEHRSYPFQENNDPKSLKRLPQCEIIDCRFFLKNGKNTKIYLKSRQETENSRIYTFCSDVGDFIFEVPADTEYKVEWIYEDYGYGFCVFGDTTAKLEDSE